MRYRIVILVGLGIVVVVAILALLFGRKDEDRLAGNLEIWGFEESAVWQDVIAAFESQHRKADVRYSKKDPASYESELLNALAGGRGPDLFAIHPSWILKHADKLAPMDDTVMSLRQFRTAFVDVAAKDLILGEKIWALPLWVDTLALYYNRDLFNAAGVVEPPRTWESFIKIVQRIVQRSETGDIILAGAAIGTAENVGHAADILEALMLQSGATMVDRSGKQAAFGRAVVLEGESFNPGETALGFYTDFANPQKASYTWNRRLDRSLEAFARGQAAMYLGYARDLARVGASGVPFAVAPFPQIIDRRADPAYIDLAYADYWALGLSRFSQNPDSAREFLRFVTSRNALFNFLTKAQLPTARRDLIEVQAKDELLAIFARQTLTADSWPQPDFQATRKVFNSMIEDVTLGRANVAEAIRTGATGISNLLQGK